MTFRQGSTYDAFGIINGAYIHCVDCHFYREGTEEEIAILRVQHICGQDETKHIATSGPNKKVEFLGGI